MERLHKIINGIRVDCSLEEDAAIRVEWETNAIESVVRKQQIEAEDELREEGLRKLKFLLNLSDQQLLLMFPPG